MELRHGFNLGLSQKQSQECSTCKQRLDAPPDSEMTGDVNLCGAEKFVICPTCKKFVPTSLRTSDYQTLWQTLTQDRGRTQAAPDPKELAETVVPDCPSTKSPGTITPEEWLRERRAFEARTEGQWKQIWHL